MIKSLSYMQISNLGSLHYKTMMKRLHNVSVLCVLMFIKTFIIMSSTNSCYQFMGHSELYKTKKTPHVWLDLSASRYDHTFSRQVKGDRWRKSSLSSDVTFTTFFLCRRYNKRSFCQKRSRKSSKRAFGKYRSANHDANCTWPVSCNKPEPAHYHWDKTATRDTFRHKYICFLVK